MPATPRNRYHFRKPILCIMLMLASLQVWAQNRFFGNNLILESRVNYGFLVNHHLEMRIYNAHFPSFEINLGKETYGKERWQTLYKYPIIGVTYWFSKMGNSEFLGSAHAVMPYVNYPLFGNNRHEFNFRVALGLGYLTKRFTRLENYKYIAIGSHINAAVNLQFEYRWRVSPRLNMATGFALAHFSNGSTKTPNYGMNTPSLNLAVSYRLSKANPYLNRKIAPQLFTFEFDGSKSIDFAAGATVAYKDMGNTYGRKFLIYNFYGNILKPVTYKSAFGIGFDISDDKSDKFTAELRGIEYELKRDLIRVGVTAGYRLTMSRLSYMFNLGYYIHGLVLPNPTYFKLGLQYDITPGIFAGVVLRTHFAEADFVGFGLGYRFKYYYLNKHSNNVRKGETIL